MRRRPLADDDRVALASAGACCTLRPAPRAIRLAWQAFSPTRFGSTNARIGLGRAHTCVAPRQRRRRTVPRWRRRQRRGTERPGRPRSRSNVVFSRAGGGCSATRPAFARPARGEAARVALAEDLRGRDAVGLRLREVGLELRRHLLGQESGTPSRFHSCRHSSTYAVITPPPLRSSPGPSRPHRGRHATRARPRRVRSRPLFEAL